MATPGSPSGTRTFALSNGELLIEAFSRIQMHPSALTRHHWEEARRSLNLELQSWSTKGGPNLWEITSGTINLAAGTATYTLPTALITLTEVWYSIVNGNGAGVNNDRILIPLTRTQYAMLSNKLQQGTPTQFWFQRLTVPQVTFWEVPMAGQAAPTYVVNWYGLNRIQDAGIGSGETPDVVYRGLDALCACMAKRLALKFAPDKLALMKAEADEAWAQFASDDQELGPMIMRPNVSSYGRIT